MAVHETRIKKLQVPIHENLLDYSVQFLLKLIRFLLKKTGKIFGRLWRWVKLNTSNNLQLGFATNLGSRMENAPFLHHGSATWLHLKGNYYWRHPIFDGTMVMGRRVKNIFPNGVLMVI